MSVYVLHLTAGILFLLVACLSLFVLFRHIEIRKIEHLNVQNEGMTPVTKQRRHTSKDDAIVLLRVLLVVVFLIILMDEDRGTQWVMVVISYLLVTFLSLLFLAKSGNLAPSVRERKWEYLALFSVLVFAAGAAIALINYSVLMMKYGKSYFGAARIVGYNEEEDAEEVEYYNEGDAEEDQGEGEGEGEKEGGEGEKEGGEGEGEGGEGEGGGGEGEGEGGEGEGGGRRKLEDEQADGDEEGEGGQSGDSGDSGDSGSGDSGSGDSGSGDGGDGASGDEYAYIKVAWGGEWGCPSHPNKYCTANIETPCSQWDVDNVYGTNTPADWKYWNNKVDGRLDGTFSCGYGFEDGSGGGDYDAYTSPLSADAGDGYPYAYIVGDCATCSANWAWTPYHRRSDEMSGYSSLFVVYLLLSVAALLVYAVLNVVRHFKKVRKSSSNDAVLLANEGGESA